MPELPIFLFKYVYLSLVLIAIIVFGASIFFEKWIGLEYIQTFQPVFFIFAFLKECPFEFSGLIYAIRYSNGYGDILTHAFQRRIIVKDHFQCFKSYKKHSNYESNGSQ